MGRFTYRFFKFWCETVFRAWLNYNAMFYKTFICFYVSETNLFVSVFVHKCLMMLNDVEYVTFKLFVTQMSNYLFVISFQLMFYKAPVKRSQLFIQHRTTFVVKKKFVPFDHLVVCCCIMLHVVVSCSMKCARDQKCL